jgi:hypothetical protein
MEQESDFFGGVLKIALGLFLGALLIWMAIEYRARYEVRQLQQVLQQSSQEVRAISQHREAQQAANREAQRVRHAEREQADYQRKIDVQRAERTKADAWSRFYQPSTQCLNDTTVECGNQHMRARKEFERLYAAGQL